MAPKQTRERLRGRKWIALREFIMRRDGGICRCQACTKTGAIKIAHEVDHITPIHLGGSDDPDNLQAINADCHKLKTAMDGGNTIKPMIGLDGFPV